MIDFIQSATSPNPFSDASLLSFFFNPEKKNQSLFSVMLIQLLYHFITHDQRQIIEKMHLFVLVRSFYAD